MNMLIVKILVPIVFLVATSIAGSDYVPGFIYENRGKLTIIAFILGNVIFWPPHDQTWSQTKLDFRNPHDRIEIIVTIVLHLLLAGFVASAIFYTANGGFRGAFR